MPPRKTRKISSKHPQLPTLNHTKKMKLLNSTRRLSGRFLTALGFNANGYCNCAG